MELNTRCVVCEAAKFEHSLPYKFDCILCDFLIFFFDYALSFYLVFDTCSTCIVA